MKAALRLSALLVLSAMSSAIASTRAEISRVPPVPETAWGEGVRIAAWLPKETFPLGRSVVVVAFQNMSDEEVTYESWAYEPAATMVGEDGRMPPTRLWKRRSGLEPTHPRRGSYKPTRIKPGETIWSVRNVGLSHDLSFPGEYTYQLNFTHKNAAPGQITIAKAPQGCASGAGRCAGRTARPCRFRTDRSSPSRS